MTMNVLQAALLFIGGTRDGQRINVPWNSGNPIFRIPVKEGPMRCSGIKNIMLPREQYTVKEIYIKKEIRERNGYTFSVMVKNGSGNLLNAFLDKYNSKE